MNKVFLSFFTLCSLSLFSQNATITGKILDEKTATPLIAATLLAGGEGTVTDLEGQFNLKLAPGTYELAASYVGYETSKMTITLGPGESKYLEIRLMESMNILETATVTSGKHEVALGEVTVSLDVIKPALIASTNQNSLSGLLEKVPGVSMIGDQANIRGGSGFSYGAGSRVLLLVDDIPIYQADSGFPQWSDVPLENIEQVEVVKGAASALYGSSALNGIINVRTAYAKSKPETMIAPFFTIYDSPKNEILKWWDSPPNTSGISISHRRKMGKLDLVLGGNYYHNNPVDEGSSSRRGRANISLRYRISDRLSIGANANMNKSKGHSFFYWYGLDSLYRAGTALSNSNNLRYNIDPFVTYFDKGNNRHKLLGRFFSVANNTGSSSVDQSQISDVYYGEYQFQRKMKKLGLVATAGGVYFGTRVKAPLYGNNTFTSRNLAAYLQIDKKFFEKLTVSAGLRFEDNTVFVPERLTYPNDTILTKDYYEDGKIHESKPVLRVGANYQVSPKTFVRASWGQGYRFPTIAEKFIYTYFGATPIVPNFNLQSETGWTTEIGIKQGFKVSGFNGFVDVAAFWMEYQDMMEFSLVLDQGIAFQSQNIGDTRIKGFEVGVQGFGKLFGLPTTILAGYTFIDPKFKEFGWDLPDDSRGRTNAINSSICYQDDDPDKEKCINVLKYRYRHTLKFDVETNINKLSIGLVANYNSFMENIDALFETPLLTNPNGEDIGLKEWRQAHNSGDVAFSARAGYQITKEIKASFIVNNLLNREYSTRPGTLESPRNFTLRLDFKF
ncbi:MAG: TonB-dependent receptor [Saprospiraceae bacterium]